jgi:hypothetical protein
MSPAALRPTPPVRICWSGQSMLGIPVAPRDVPYMATVQVGLPPWDNISHGGEGWAELLADRLAELQAARLRPADVHVLAMDGGQDDIISPYPDTPTAAEAYAAAVAYATAGRTTGFDYVAISTMPAFGPLFGRLTPDEQVVWDATNALIVANSGGFDAVIRCDTPPFLDTSLAAGIFDIDRVHLTQRGGQVKADRWAEGLLTLPPFA